MPYVVTTKRPTRQIRWPETRCVLGYEIVPASASRVAVATLEEARETCARITGPYSWRMIEIHQITESGGTVGPLPDGTVIEVEPVEWYWLYDKSGYGRTSQASDDTVIAAFNARETRS